MMFKILNNIVDISIDPTVLVPNTLPTRAWSQLKIPSTPGQN